MTRDDVRIGIILAGILCSGCAFEPDGAVPFTPPPSYQALWDSAQACTGRRGDFGELRWYVAPAIERGGELYGGHTNGTTIYLAAGWTDHPMVVKHEMIHALGVHGHPSTPFAAPCRATWETWPGY